MKTREGQTIFSFRGIPYGIPPLAGLRFKRSRLYGAWSGVLNGTKEAKKSLQPNVLFPTKEYLSEGGEDCLYLNVYTKTLDENARKPVIVFLHGGAFVVGSCEAALYGPQVLLDRDVVLVGVNYRLGVLGWLSLETDEAPGNLGLHDQFLALQWVQQNIEEFGGDPSNVTLMGESAGAMSALLHLVSPVSRGLFHRMIALSGTPSSVFLHTDRRPRLYALEVAKALGCEDTDDLDKVLVSLQQQDAKRILAVSTLFTDWDHAHPMPWTPCRDTHAEVPLVPRDLKSALEAGEAGSIPVIMGCCRDEGLIMTAKFFKEPERWKLLASEWSIWAPLLLFNRERDMTTADDRKDVEEIRQFYFPHETDISNLPPSDENIQKLTEMLSMSWFQYPMDRDSKLIAQNGGSVYTFLLTYPPDFSLFELFRLGMKKLGWLFSARRLGLRPYSNHYGVCHGDDLCYLFPLDVPGFPARVRTGPQKQTQRHLLDVVCSFAKSGKPTLKDGETVWRPVSDTAHEYLEVAPLPIMTRDQELSRQLDFWRGIKTRTEARESELSSRPFGPFFKEIAVHRQ